MTDLLPANSTALERDLATVFAEIEGIETPARLMWDPDRIPAAFLPWLAWSLSVDDWDPDWSEERKREVIKGSVALHRIKGTRKSVEMALQMMGYGAARIVEDRDLPRIGDEGLLIGGTGWALGDAWVLGPDDPHWADYWVEVPVPIDRSDADLIAERLANVAPARCRLRGVTLTGVYFTLGDDLWLIGDDITLGGSYDYEVA